MACMSDKTALEWFRIVATEFNQMPNSEVETFICIAESCLNSDFYGEKYNYAVALKTASIIYQKNQGASLPSFTTSSKAGDLSKNSQAVAGVDGAVDGYESQLNQLTSSMGCGLYMDTSLCPSS